MRVELVTTLKRQATKILSELHSSKEPVLITEHGQPSAYLVVNSFLQRDPTKRLGTRGDAEEVKAHPFFAGLDWGAISRRELFPGYRPRKSSGRQNMDTRFIPE